MLEDSSLCEYEAIPWGRHIVALVVCHKVMQKVLLFHRKSLQVFKKKNVYYEP